MCRRRRLFENEVNEAVKSIRLGGVVLSEVPPINHQSTRISCLDSWRCPGTVAEYRTSDYQGRLSEERVQALDRLVDEFRLLTGSFDPGRPCPSVEAERADELLLIIHDIIAGQAGRE